MRTNGRGEAGQEVMMGLHQDPRKRASCAIERRTSFNGAMFKLETERLLVRPWQVNDRDAFRAMAQDERVMRYINGGLALTEQQIDETLARQAKNLAEHGICMGALVEKATSRVVGVAGLQLLGTTGELEIGWWLVPDVWGRGYATEAALAGLEYAFDTLRRPRVMAIIDPPNEASKKVAARIGMRLVHRTTGAELGHRLPDIVVDLFERVGPMRPA